MCWDEKHDGWVHRRLDIAEKKDWWTWRLIAMKTIQNETEKKNHFFLNEKILSELWDSFKWPDVYVNGIPKGIGRKNI